MANKKKGLSSGIRRHQGSFLRSFLSDAIDTAQQAVDEFIERDFDPPPKPPSPPAVQAATATSQAAEKSQQETAARIDELAKMLETLAAMVSDIKKTQATESQKLTEPKGDQG